MLKKITIGIAALGAVALVAAPVASADEASYIDDLVGAGFGNYSAGDALAIGYAVCDGVAAGWTQGQLVEGVYANTVGSIDGGEANYIVEAAEIWLC